MNNEKTVKTRGKRAVILCAEEPGPERSRMPTILVGPDLRLVEQIRAGFSALASEAERMIKDRTSGRVSLTRETYVDISFHRKRMRMSAVAYGFAIVHEKVRGAAVDGVRETDVEALEKFVKEGPEHLVRSLINVSEDVAAAGSAPRTAAAVYKTAFNSMSHTTDD